MGTFDPIAAVRVKHFTVRSNPRQGLNAAGEIQLSIAERSAGARFGGSLSDPGNSPGSSAVVRGCPYWNEFMPCAGAA